jgi:DNA polymerase III subunit chi
MTRLDFYILSSDYSGDRWQFACRLAEKAYAQGHRVYLHSGSDGEARYLDRLLWTFRDSSFVPHGLLGEADAALNPVLLGSGVDPLGEDDVLINCSREVPAFFERFQRVAEIVDGDPQVRRTGRERFRFYRDRGCPLETHELHR